MSVLRKLHSSSSTQSESALATMAIGAIFFCMRSCEYLKTPKNEEKRTKLLKVKNFRFFTETGQLIQHISPELASADCVCVTFENQKNGGKYESVTIHKTEDKVLCPVIAWATTVKRILGYPGESDQSPINTYITGNNKFQFSSSNMIAALRTTVENMPEANLGFVAKEIGTHSIRSGGAMAMCLIKESDFMIKLLGRWKSDSFLKYIRKQIKQLSQHISKRMLAVEHFNHITAAPA